MNLYAVLRRRGWASAADLETAAERSTRVGVDLQDRVRWIRSYVLDEPDGSVGTVCVYLASSPEALHEHASKASFPIDEVIEVADTVIVRPDPEPATQA